jgi:hypothetical protein
MTATKLVWGPGSIGRVLTYGAAGAVIALSDSNNAAGWSFNFPKDGTVTDVGFLITVKTGTPPAYNAGLVTLDTSGRPSTSAYGGSAITEYTPTATGWKWATLSTPATANAGDYAAVHVYPTGTAPDASNYVSLSISDVSEGGIGVQFLISWAITTLAIPMAIKYDDGSIYGFALSSATLYASIANNTTPDELGCKFTVPAAMTIVGLRFPALSTSLTGPFDIVIYSSDDTALATTSVADKDFEDDLSVHTIYFDPVNLTAGATYRAVIKPTSSSSIVCSRFLFESSAAKAMFPQGENWQATERTDAGAWTDTALDIVPMSLIVSDITFTGAPAATGGAFAYIG